MQHSSAVWLEVRAKNLPDNRGWLIFCNIVAVFLFRGWLFVLRGWLFVLRGRLNCSAVQRSTEQCSAGQRSAAQYSAVKRYTAQ